MTANSTRTSEIISSARENSIFPCLRALNKKTQGKLSQHTFSYVSRLFGKRSQNTSFLSSLFGSFSLSPPTCHGLPPLLGREEEYPLRPEGPEEDVDPEDHGGQEGQELSHGGEVGAQNDLLHVSEGELVDDDDGLDQLPDDVLGLAQLGGQVGQGVGRPDTVVGRPGMKKKKREL